MSRTHILKLAILSHFSGCFHSVCPFEQASLVMLPTVWDAMSLGLELSADGVTAGCYAANCVPVR